MSDNEKETQVAEETQNTQAAAEATNEDRKSRRGQRGEGRRGERRNRREESHENEMLYCDWSSDVCSSDLAFETCEIAHQSGFAHQGNALGVIDDLGNHVTVGTGNHQTRELRGTADALAQTSVTALKRDLLALTENLDAHYLPAFPALRRMRSSEYLMPLPL